MGTVAWYVARTKSAKEHHAASALAQRGVEVYLPTLDKLKARTGRRSHEPLFPGYLFACLQIPSQQWLAARSAPCIAYFVSASDGPTALPHGFISALKTRMGLVEQDGGLARLRPGERVVITEGPFQYVEAIFDQCLSPSGRSRVLIELLHRSVRVELPEHQLEKVGPLK